MSFLFSKPDNHYEFSPPNKPQDRVKLLEPVSFQRIINDDLGRPKHQIIDIREKEEYDIAHLEGDDIIRLPLSEKENWIDDIRKGKKLDPNKTTIVVDHYGVRSYNFAIFLGKERNSDALSSPFFGIFLLVAEAHFYSVFTLQGGIDEYTRVIDHSLKLYE
jgi:rhodanese-related sulfurtransferase